MSRGELIARCRLALMRGDDFPVHYLRQAAKNAGYNAADVMRRVLSGRGKIELRDGVRWVTPIEG